MSSTHVDNASSAATEATETQAGSIHSTPHVLTPIQEQDSSESASVASKEDTHDSTKEDDRYVVVDVKDSNKGDTHDVTKPGAQDADKQDDEDAAKQDGEDAAKQDGKDADEEDPQDAPKQDSQDSNAQAVVVSFHVHSDATFQVLVADVLIKFKVSAQLVATASPVLRTILYGQDVIVPTPNGNWVVDIEAEPKALETLFRIVHYQFQKVPSLLSLDELYELTLLTARFKCVHLIYPWARKWATQFSTYACEDDHFDHCHKVVWIAWELGDEKLFRDMVHAMIISSKVNAEGDLVNASDSPLKDMILPPGILGLVSTTRMSTIGAILAGLNASMLALTVGDREPGTKFCKLGKEERQCEAMLLGSAIQELIKNHLYPVPAANSFLKSISVLKDTLQAMKFMTFVGPDRRPHHTHEHCNPGFRGLAERCVEDMAVALEDPQLKYLQSQAVLSGINAALDVRESRTRTFKTGKTVFKDTWIDSSKKIALRQAKLAQGVSSKDADVSDGEFEWQA